MTTALFMCISACKSTQVWEDVSGHTALTVCHLEQHALKGSDWCLESATSSFAEFVDNTCCASFSYCGNNHKSQNMQGPTMQELLAPFPKVQKWLAAVAETTEPEWSKASSFLNKVAQRGRERKSKAQQSKL